MAVSNLGKAESHRIELLHGCNLDMLGRRDPAQYGTATLAQLESEIVARGATLGLEVRPFQTNHEGALVEKIHDICQSAAGVIINPGAWTHYSYAIHDALELVAGPVVEVHLSDINNREEWRRLSVISDVAQLTISGKGREGYFEALEWLARRLGPGR